MNVRACLLSIGLALPACDGGGAPPPAPPVPAQLASLDPELIQAIETACEGVRRAPDDAAAWSRLGMTYEAHVLHDLALVCYEQAVLLAGNDARGWYRLAMARTRDADLDGAVQAFERVLRLEPGYQAARLRLGRVHLDAGSVDEAARAFEQVAAQEPDNPSALIGLAEVQLERGDSQGALDALGHAALDIAAHRPLVQRLRGTALARLGRDEEARDALAQGKGARAVIADPWSREVGDFKVGTSALLMRAKRLVDRGKVDSALELLEPLAAVDEPEARVLRQLGVAYARARRWSDAADLLARAYSIESDDPDLALALAAALEAARRPGEMVRVLDEALARDPGHAELRTTRQSVALSQADYARAIELRDGAGEGHGLAALEVGALRAELELGRMAAARTSLARATDLAPDHPDLPALRARLDAADDDG